MIFVFHFYLLYFGRLSIPTVGHKPRSTALSLWSRTIWIQAISILIFSIATLSTQLQPAYSSLKDKRADFGCRCTNATRLASGSKPRYHRLAPYPFCSSPVLTPGLLDASGILVALGYGGSSRFLYQGIKSDPPPEPMIWLHLHC